MTHIVGEMNHIVGEMKQIVGEMKQNCWGNEAKLLGKWHKLLGKWSNMCWGNAPNTKWSHPRPDQTRPDQRGNFTLYLGHFPNTYCFTSPTMCVISPTILLHFPNNFASSPQQYGSFPQQYGSFPQQYESFPQIVFSFPQQFCVTFPNPRKQISPPKNAFFTIWERLIMLKSPHPHPPFMFLAP